MSKKIQVLVIFSLVFLPFSFLFASTEEPEEIRIFFTCEEPGFLEKPSLQHLKLLEEEKIQFQSGKVLFLAKSKETKEPIEYAIRNGNFLLYPDSSQKDSGKYLFVLGYSERENNSSGTWIYILEKNLPNGYRRLGNQIFLSCPPSPRELGKLRLVFRERKLIRHSFTFIQVSGLLGDI